MKIHIKRLQQETMHENNQKKNTPNIVSLLPLFFSFLFSPIFIGGCLSFLWIPAMKQKVHHTSDTADGVAAIAVCSDDEICVCTDRLRGDIFRSRINWWYHRRGIRCRNHDYCCGRWRSRKWTFLSSTVGFFCDFLKRRMELKNHTFSAVV